MLNKIVGTIWKLLTPYLRLKIVRVTQQKFTVSAAAIIINENREILLLDHIFRSASSWGVPGGFLNSGEQPEEAVRREIREETGLELHNIEMFRVRTIHRHIEILFRARAIGKAEVKSSEIKEAAWFQIDKIPKQMDEDQKMIVQEVFRSIKV